MSRDLLPWADIASVILAVATTVSLLYVARQVNVARRQTRGQFLLALDDLFTRSRPVLQKLIAEPQFVPVGKEWPDRLHGFMPLRLMANDAIYQRLLSTGAEWRDFIDLCRLVAKHRRTKTVGPRHAVFLQRVDTLDKDAEMDDPWQF